MAQLERLVRLRMSKEEFERLFEAPMPTGSALHASLLERTTIATLACSAFASVIGIVFTAIEGGLL